MFRRLIKPKVPVIVRQRELYFQRVYGVAVTVGVASGVSDADAGSVVAVGSGVSDSAGAMF